jgi:hypothetical protein
MDVAKETMTVFVCVFVSKSLSDLFRSICSQVVDDSGIQNVALRGDHNM